MFRISMLTRLLAGIAVATGLSVATPAMAQGAATLEVTLENATAEFAQGFGHGVWGAAVEGVGGVVQIGVHLAGSPRTRTRSMRTDAERY